MRRTILMIFMLASLTMWAGSKITRSYVRQPLPEVLIDIDRAAPEVNISFMYDKLEDYIVTCSLHDASPIEAVLQVIGFYPVRMSQSGANIVVEPIHDAARRLVGRIADERGVPLEFANIALLSPTDSAFIGGGVANASGDFAIPCDLEHVLLRASHIGYTTVERACVVGDVGTIVLAEDAIALAEVRKTGTRQLARMERGALVYDMQLLCQIMPADDAYEALKRIPGVSEVNGSMEFAGQTVTLIVNGKPSVLTPEQMKERLKMMPPERVAKAEVMMSAPARYHTRGAVINIVTKDLYGQHQLSGQAKGVGSFSKRSFGSTSGSLLWTQGKLSIDASYGYSGGGQYGKVEHRATQPMAAEAWSYHDATEGISNFGQHQLYSQLEYAFAPDHRMALALNGLWSDSRSHNTTMGTMPTEQRSTTSKSVANADASYVAPFGLKLGASYTHFAYPQTQFLDNTIQSDCQGIASESEQTIDKWAFAADHSHAFKHDWTLSYGAEMKLTKHESWQETHTYDGHAVDEATGSVGYTERISSLYASLAKNLGKKMSVEVGAQGENYHTPQWNEWRVYPTMNLMWRATPQSIFNLSLSSNSRYPDYWSLMKSVFYSSRYSEIWGNPDLKPMSSYDVSLMWQFRQRYTLTAFYTCDDHFFVQLPFQPADRMAVIMQVVNFNFRQNAGLVASAQWRISSWANGNATAAMIYTHDRSDHFHDIPFDRENLAGRLSANVAIAPFARQSLKLIAEPMYQFGTIQGVYDIHDFFSLDLTLRWTDRTGRLSASVKGSNLTNFHFQTADTWRGQNFMMAVWQNWRTAHVSLTYRIGDYKEKKRKQADTSRMGH